MVGLAAAIPMIRLFIFTVIIGAAAAIAPHQVAAAGEKTPPATTLLRLDGTVGNNDWYTSTVDVSLQAKDLESGVASTTYQIDSLSPITRKITGTTNSILNPSFENGNFFGITNWDRVDSGFGFLYQTSTPSKYDYGSAAVLSILSQYQYWTNVNYASQVQAGKTYTASSWVKTLNIGSPGAWMEVWAADSSSSLPDILVQASEKVVGDWDWRLLNVEFTVPSGYDQIYLKLGDKAGLGIAFFDGASLNASNGNVTQFSLVDNGVHSFNYYSEDNAGNVEPQHTYGPVKIDTVAPQDWRNFDYSTSGNNHSYAMWVSVRDVTSGIDPTTAQFQSFDKDGCDCWSSWQNVSSVTRLDNGQPAPAGYTGYVKVTINSYDFGNSAKATRPEVHFRINDVAGSESKSPDYAIFGAWVRLTGGDVYSAGSISIPGLVPDGQYSADGVVATGSGDSISGLVSPQAWYITRYPAPMAPISGLKTYIPQLDKLQRKAQPLTAGRLPSSSGIYGFDGKFTIDSNTLTAGFQAGVYNAVIIINGDLAINSRFALNPQTAVVFLVTGDVIYQPSVEFSAGIIIAAKTINTGASSTVLTHTGALIGLGGVSLGRDLGRKGNPNNSTTPAEVISFPSQYLANQGLARLLNGGGGTDFHWQEQW